MLKIREDRLKDLEEFGFRKLYDERTGELLLYDIGLHDKANNLFASLEVYVPENNHNYPPCLLKLRHLQLRYLHLKEYTEEYVREIIDSIAYLVFRLTIGGMVEKVVEDE